MNHAQDFHAVFELKGVSKVYNSRQALYSIDLVIPSERTTVIIGPSGSGKSTILRLMIGLIRQDAGRVLFQGTEVTSSNIRDLRHRMGYVIQSSGLFPHLTARENIVVMAQYLGWEKVRTEERLQELVDLTQFPKDGLLRFPMQLSGGQRQRVALMRALMLNPDVLLLDEPLGALDPLIRSDLQNDLKQIFYRLGKSVVLVTHDIGEAGFLSDFVVLLSAGRIIQRGTIQEFVDTPADPFVTRFINAQRSPLETLKGKGV